MSFRSLYCKLKAINYSMCGRETDEQVQQRWCTPLCKRQQEATGHSMCYSTDESTHLLRWVALLYKGSPDRARGNGIHPDAPADQVGPQTLGEGCHGSLHMQGHRPGQEYVSTMLHVHAKQSGSAASAADDSRLQSRAITLLLSLLCSTAASSLANTYIFHTCTH